MQGFPAQDYTINKLWPVAQRKGLVGFCSLQLRWLAQQHGTTTACGWQSRLWLAQQHGTTTACGWQSRLWLTGQQPPVAGRRKIPQSKSMHLSSDCYCWRQQCSYHCEPRSNCYCWTPGSDPTH